MLIDSLIAALALATNGVSTAHVFVHQLSSRLEQKAGVELGSFLAKAHRLEVPVINEPRGDIARRLPTEIVPITLEHGRRLVPPAAVKALEATDNKDAFVIATRENKLLGNGVYIVGKTDVGVLYGAYAFLEDYVGYRFFHAGPAGTYVPPRKKDVSLEDGLCDFREPKVAFRRVQSWYGSVKPLSQDKDVDWWFARRGFQFREYWGRQELTSDQLTQIAAGNMAWQGGGETMLRDGVPISLFETHPEYFPLVSGKRDRKAAEKQMRRCLSNPEVKKMAIRHAVRHCLHSPSYGVDYRDEGGGWCECANCIAYGTGKDGKYSVPNAAHRFTKEVTDAVLKLVPEAEMQLLVYRDYREPVSNDVVFDRRVHGFFCPHQRCYAHALDDPDCSLNRPFLRKYNFWRTRCPGIGFFDYYCYSDSRYCPVEWVLEKDFKAYFARDGFHCWIEDCSGGSADDCWGYILCNWQMYYLAAKLMWDPTIDAKRLFDEGYDLYYGPAAKPMKAYHAYRRELWDSAPGHCYMSNFRRWNYALGVEGAEKTLKGFLAEAERLAANDRDAKTRIGLDRRMLDMFWVKGWESVKDRYVVRPDAATPPVNMPANGDFRLLDKEGFPTGYWSDKKRFADGAVVLTNALLIAFTDNPTFAKEHRIRLTVEAEGKGRLRLGLPYCIREPGNAAPVKQEKDLPMSKELTLDGKKTYVLDGTMPAYARCYISFFGANARIKSVRLDFPE